MDNTRHAYSGGRPVYIIDGNRTPFLKAQGRPGPFRAADLAVAAGKSLLARQPFAPQALDEVILGCVIPAPDEVNIARLVALRLGCGARMPAWTVQRNCGSGMQSLDSAAMDIAFGRADLVLAGGSEAMSHAPVLLPPPAVELLGDWFKARSSGERARLLTRLRPAHFRLIFGLLQGLTDPVVNLSMGQTAEVLAQRFAISRSEMDAYAVESHLRLAHAQDQGWLTEIEPLYAPDGTVCDHDDGVRRDSDVTRLARLKPAFDRRFGLVTAGNSAQVSDGAALLILASADAVRKHQLPVLGRIVDCAWAGLDPEQMGLGPVHAMAPLLLRQGLQTRDIDYWEINEAFAAQVLACLAAWQSDAYARTELGLGQAFAAIDPERLNVDGGAVACGHPVGTSGARIVLHLLQVLRRTGSQRGMASLCIGGGQGGAMLLERSQEAGHEQ
ncbi:MAG: acetyl-CoA C-acetyltransferase [Desulfobacteraceae bacterium]|nr:acetyl-CoA C-acetyltransferase [Desulfobacteraceae bacterium]